MFDEYIISLVYKNNGKIFGGYITDYLINRNNFKLLIKITTEMSNMIYNYISYFKYNNIDIWFTNNDDRDNFFDDIEKSYYIKFIFMDKIKYRYDIWNNNNSITCNIFVSDIFPGNDFSINLLSYDGENFKVEQIKNTIAKISFICMRDTIYFNIKINDEEYYTKPLEFSVSTILDHIQNKKLVILYDYFGCDTNNEQYIKFINKGYKLSTSSGVKLYVY